MNVSSFDDPADAERGPAGASGLAGDDSDRRRGDEPPRVRISVLQWIAFGVLLTAFASLTAVLSIYARRTRLEQTTRFWGQPVITALQLADKVELSPVRGIEFEPVELTATPGLGHLRRALLDERHFTWESETAAPVRDLCADEESICVRLRLSDSVGNRAPTTEIDLELQGGWVGLTNGEKRVQVNDRVRPALRHQLLMMSNVPPDKLRED